MTKRLCLFLVFSSLISVKAKAQVTIGIDEAPVHGALLQLKNLADASSSDNINSTKGLGMPRMVLTNRYDLTNVLDNPSSTEEEDHIGLVVYQTGHQNSDEFGIFCPGLYVWNGEEWTEMFDINKNDKSRYDPATEILYDSEGNDYKTAQFGSAGRWMTQNLRSTLGHPCLKVGLSAGADDKLDEPLYYFPGGTSSPGVPEAPATWTKEQGLLYNWAAATMKKGGSDGKGQGFDEGEGYNAPNFAAGNVEETGVRGLCPKGWHLPSDKEWNELLCAISECRANKYSDACMITQVEDWDANWNVVKGWQGEFSGTHMKSKKTVLESYTTNGLSKTRTENGFDILLIGNALAAYHNLFGRYAYFWTSSAYDETKAWHRHFYHKEDANGNGKSIYRAPEGREYMFSVRCKQD
ncbi:MAG: fibrobacter succinogenes major paralogous domain-containing protein [Prevotella sp.]|jgi:uncharacterized protein (TIGR02145 family)|nr:fibrobacter succinogenes major paralogous domain-containing protein [Prevotella sp.]